MVSFSKVGVRGMFPSSLSPTPRVNIISYMFGSSMTLDRSNMHPKFDPIRVRTFVTYYKNKCLSKRKLSIHYLTWHTKGFPPHLLLQLVEQTVNKCHLSWVKWDARTNRQPAWQSQYICMSLFWFLFVCLFLLYLLYQLEDMTKQISIPHDSWCCWDSNLHLSPHLLYALPLCYGFWHVLSYGVTILFCPLFLVCLSAPWMRNTQLFHRASCSPRIQKQAVSANVQITLWGHMNLYFWHYMYYHSTKKPVTTMLTCPWKCTVLHCNHLGNTWKPLVLMTRHFDYYPSASEGDNQSVRSSAPVVSRCFPGGYNVKLYISRGRLAWWLLAFLHSVW